MIPKGYRNPSNLLEASPAAAFGLSGNRKRTDGCPRLTGDVFRFGKNSAFLGSV